MRRQRNMFEGIGAVPYDPGLTGRTGAIVNFGNGLLNGVDLADRFQQRRDAKADRAMQIEDRTQQMGLAAEDRRYTMEERQRKRQQEDEAAERSREINETRRRMDEINFELQRNNAEKSKHERWRSERSVEADATEVLLDIIDNPDMPPEVQQQYLERARTVMGDKLEPTVQYLKSKSPEERAKTRRNIAVGRGLLKDVDVSASLKRFDEKTKAAQERFDALPDGEEKAMAARQMDLIEDEIATFVNLYKSSPYFGDVVKPYEVDPSDDIKHEQTYRRTQQARKTVKDDKPGFWKNDDTQSRKRYSDASDYLYGIGAGTNRPAPASAPIDDPLGLLQ